MHTVVRVKVTDIVAEPSIATKVNMAVKTNKTKVNIKKQVQSLVPVTSSGTVPVSHPREPTSLRVRQLDASMSSSVAAGGRRGTPCLRGLNSCPHLN